MKLYDMWEGFSTEQYSYITNIIKNSDAKTICELGTFVGSTAKQVWDSIKDTDKELYLVDNYAFLPERKRQKFFNAVKSSIDPKTKNIKFSTIYFLRKLIERHKRRYNDNKLLNFMYFL